MSPIAPSAASALPTEFVQSTVGSVSGPTGIEQLPEGTQGAISGRPLLIRAGAVETSFDCNDPITLACTRAPV